MNGHTCIHRSLLPLTLAALLALCACGGTADLEAFPELPGDPAPGTPAYPVITRPAEEPAAPPARDTFDLALRVRLGRELPCQPSEWKWDCKGILIWAVYTWPNAEGPQPRLLAWGNQDAYGQRVIRTPPQRVPRNAEMMLLVFLDDDASFQPPALLPDRGDAYHVDTTPFSAGDRRRVTRKVVLEHRAE